MLAKTETNAAPEHSLRLSGFLLSALSADAIASIGTIPRPTGHGTEAYSIERFASQVRKAERSALRQRDSNY